MTEPVGSHIGVSQIKILLVSEKTWNTKEERKVYDTLFIYITHNLVGKRQV